MSRIRILMNHSAYYWCFLSFSHQVLVFGMKISVFYLQTFRMLDTEEGDDTQMREHFKERWNRTPSNKLTQQLREEGNKYKAILANATSADGIVKEKYNTHRRGMEILSKSDVSII